MNPPEGTGNVKPPKKTVLTVNVSVKDTELFEHMLKIFGEFCLDERVPESVRLGYVYKVIRHGQTFRDI